MELEFGLLAFTSLFTMINPVGVVPVFISMTIGLSPREKRNTARKATLTALLLLLMFAITGQFIFQFFGISVDSLRVAGGIILFMIGYDLLHAKISRTRYDENSTDNVTYMKDIAITPLAIPIIGGPGAIATSIVLFQEAHTPSEQGMVFLAIVAVIITTYLILISGERIMRIIGDDGNKVLMRLMGLIVMVIAVEFFFGGLKPILRDILMIKGA